MFSSVMWVWASNSRSSVGSPLSGGGLSRRRVCPDWESWSVQLQAGSTRGTAAKIRRLRVHLHPPLSFLRLRA